jgi:hypothetical protein
MVLLIRTKVLVEFDHLGKMLWGYIWVAGRFSKRHKRCMGKEESVNQSSTGSLIRLTAEGLRLELGIPMTPGTINWKVVKEYSTPAWYGSLLDFITKHPIEIIEDYPQMTLLRQKTNT